MTEGRTQTSKTQGATAERNGSKRGGAIPGAQEAADLIKSTAERAAERWPDAVAGAQIAARDTQQALERMPNQGLVIGTSFSIGLGVGLFMSGSNRLLVLLALAPAAAMAATLVAREEQTLSASGTGL
jgi:pantoate kinase